MLRIEVTIHLSNVDRVLEGDVTKQVEEALQCVVVLGCPILSSSPDDIVSLDLQKKRVNKTKLQSFYSPSWAN